MSDAINRSIFVHLLTSILNNDVEKVKKYIQGTNYIYPTTGWTALHYACDKKSSYEVINYLIQANSKATCKKCLLGQTPLHIILINRIDDENILQLMINASLSCANNSSYLKDNDGNNLLHLALKYFCPINVIKALMKYYPKLVKMKNKDDMIPIDMFYMAWYPIIRNFLEHDLLHPKYQSEGDTFINKSIRLMNWHGSTTIDDFYETIFYLLNATYNSTTTSTNNSFLSFDKSVELHHSSIWLSIFSNRFFGSYPPWTFYELFIHLHMSQIENNLQIYTKVLQTLVATTNQDNSKFYSYKLTCGYCNTTSSYRIKNKTNDFNYIAISRDCDLCYSCSNCCNNKGNIMTKAFDRTMLIDESVEQLQAIYTLLRENPSVFIISLNNSGVEERNDVLKIKRRESISNKIGRTIKACTNIVSRRLSM